MLPICVFLEMVTLSKLMHGANAPSPIEITEEGMVTLVKLSQKANAISPIEVTEEGMVTLVKL